MARVMGVEQTLEASFDVLVVDDICSFLTPRLVAAVKESGSEVVGVFSPDDGSDAKRRLLECGIADVIESDASPDEFLEVMKACLAHRSQAPDLRDVAERRSLTVGVTGAVAGVGITEVAVGLAVAVSSRLDATLVDLDTAWPSVAQRIDLPLHPNLRTALDVVVHRSDDFSAAAHQVGSLTVIGGVVDGGVSRPVSHSELNMLLDVVARSAEVLIADLGPLGSAPKGCLVEFDTVVIVGTADPVGVTRLIATASEMAQKAASSSPVIVINKCPLRRYHESEVRAELEAALVGVPVLVLPFDRRVSEAMWDGVPTPRGPFVRAIKRMAALIESSVVR